MLGVAGGGDGMVAVAGVASGESAASASAESSTLAAYRSVVSDTLVPLHASRLAALQAAESAQQSWASLSLQLAALAETSASSPSAPLRVHADAGCGIFLPCEAAPGAHSGAY